MNWLDLAIYWANNFEEFPMIYGHKIVSTQENQFLRVQKQTEYGENDYDIKVACFGKIIYKCICI